MGESRTKRKGKGAAGIMRRLGRFLSCRSASTSVSLAIAAPALLSAVGVATDMAVFAMKKAELQSYADNAAVAAANELLVGNKDATLVQATVDTYVQAAVHDTARNVKPDTKPNDEMTAVTVSLTEEWTPFFAHFVGMDITPIITTATASLAGESKICVLAINPSGVGALSMTQDSYLQANGCSVYSNSTNALGIYLGDSSTIESQLICSAGGFFGKGSNSAGSVMKDCPAIADPLASRPLPAVGTCDYTGATYSSGKHVLKPGVYCKGLDITGTAEVSFDAGTYIIKDGPFKISNKAVVTGKDVGFYLTGSASLINFTNDAQIEFSGAESGDLAGLLFFEDPKSSLFRVHRINASGAHTLTGTIYLPKGNLLIDPSASVGDKSAYTALVVRRLIVENGPRLVLNSDYSATKVPVPAGISSSGQVVLSD